jgi:hypothetical protein
MQDHARALQYQYGIPRSASASSGEAFRVALHIAMHGSWLDLAESELSVLSGQCLERRFLDKQGPIEGVAL